MPTLSENKQERINIRLQSSAKTLLERAALFEGETVSAFIVSNALKHARQVIQKHESAALNETESVAFLNALDKPIQFNQALTQALEEHNHRVISK